MTAGDPNSEQSIVDACQAQDFGLAIRLALEAYGAEILSFLSGRLHSHSDGEEAFSMFAEDLLKALPQFSFRCSVRGYLYTVARNAANRFASAPHNKRARNLPLSADPALSAIIDHARSVTAMHRRTEVKDKIRGLRDGLAKDDQMLLTLHVDRNLPWSEIAMVMRGDGEVLAGEELVRETARLRKRFERIKLELRELAIAQGMIKQ